MDNQGSSVRLSVNSKEMLSPIQKDMNAINSEIELFRVKMEELKKKTSQDHTVGAWQAGLNQMATGTAQMLPIWALIAATGIGGPLATGAFLTEALIQFSAGYAEYTIRNYRD